MNLSQKNRNWNCRGPTPLPAEEAGRTLPLKVRRGTRRAREEALGLLLEKGDRVALAAPAVFGQMGGILERSVCPLQVRALLCILFAFLEHCGEKILSLLTTREMGPVSCWTRREESTKLPGFISPHFPQVKGHRPQLHHG